jgi:hypothetical protein
MSLQPQLQLVAARLYVQQQRAVRRTLGGAVERVWDEFDWAEWADWGADELPDDFDEDWEEANLGQQYSERVAPLARAAQRGLVSTLGGYMAVVARTPYKGLDMDDLIEGATTSSWQTPAFSMWQAIAAGAAITAAIAAARAEAERKAQTQLAIVQAAAMARYTEGTGIGYRRVLAGPGCSFCRELVDEVNYSGEEVGLHPGCNCALVPVQGEGDPGALMNEEVLAR